MTDLGTKILFASKRDKISHDLERLEEFSCFIEDALRKELRRIKSKAIKELQNSHDAFNNKIIAESYAEDIFQIETDFPRLQRYALFVSLMSLVESTIVGLCQTTKRLFNVSEDFNAAKPRVIDRGVSFVKRHAKIDVNNLIKDLKLLQNLSQIRNCIVHAQGSLKTWRNADIIKNLIKSKTLPNLTCDNHDRIVFKQGFIEKHIKKIHKFLEVLLSKIFLCYSSKAT